MSEVPPEAVRLAPAHGRTTARLRRTGLVLVIVIAPIASAMIGYNLGTQDRRAAAPTSYPVWTDQEIRSTGTQNVGTRRCSYHLADGTVKVREPVIALFVGASPSACPPP